MGKDKGMTLIAEGIQRGDESFPIQREDIVIRYDHDFFPVEILGYIFSCSDKNAVFYIDRITVFSKLTVNFMSCISFIDKFSKRVRPLLERV